MFQMDITRALNPVEERSERIDEILRETSKVFNWEGLKFPVNLSDINKFENHNSTISVNVFGYEYLVYPLRISQHNYKRESTVNLLDARSRYTDFAQRLAPEGGIPSARYVTACARSRHTCGTVYNRQPPEDGIQTLFSNAYWPQHSGVIEIQTRQQLKNNCFHETQRICMNKFCIWTPSGQRTS